MRLALTTFPGISSSLTALRSRWVLSRTDQQASTRTSKLSLELVPLKRVEAVLPSVVFHTWKWFLLSGVMGNFQHTVSIDTMMQLVDSAFNTVPLAISMIAFKTALLQTRLIWKRISPFDAGIALEARTLDLAELKWLKIAAVAFLSLAWGLPFYCSAPLLNARVDVTSIPGSQAHLPETLNSSCDNWEANSSI